MSQPSTLTRLCAKFIQRADHLALKGKKRDDAALDYLIGAASALYTFSATHGLDPAAIAAAHSDAQHIATVTAAVITVRGFSEVARIVLDAEKALVGPGFTPTGDLRSAAALFASP